MMRNLAGDKNCDEYIRRELTHARINIVERKLPAVGEVRYKLTGELHGWTFERRWYYYSCKGAMPIEKARDLWNDPLGRDDVRVDGHCGCPSPDESWEAKETGLVHTYHVGSEAGLRLLADAIREVSSGK
jgi:hypothetical protein